MFKYDIVKEHSIDELIKSVNERIATGDWYIEGGFTQITLPTSGRVMYGQTMMYYKEDQFEEDESETSILQHYYDQFSKKNTDNVFSFATVDRYDDTPFQQLARLNSEECYVVWYRNDVTREVRYMGVWYFIGPATLISYFGRNMATVPDQLYRLHPEAIIEIHRFHDVYGGNFEFYAEQYDRKQNLVVSAQRQHLYVGGIEGVEGGIKKAEITIVPLVEHITDEPFNEQLWNYATSIAVKLEDIPNDESVLEAAKNMFFLALTRDLDVDREAFKAFLEARLGVHGLLKGGLTTIFDFDEEE